MSSLIEIQQQSVRLQVAGGKNRRRDIAKGVMALIAAAAMVDCAAPSIHAATVTSTWTGAADSNWSNAANWSPNTVDPNNGNGGNDYDVIIGTPSPTTLNISVTIDDLTINTGGLLNIQVNNNLNLDGTTVTDNGGIVVDSGNNGGTTILEFDNANSLLTGTGAVTLNGGGTAAQLNTGTGDAVTQDVGHSIVGFGEVNAALTNNGTVDASVSGQTLALGTNSMTNNSVFEATAGGNLNINEITVTQGTGGSISAAGGSVNLTGGTTISGGTLSSSGTSAIFNTGGTNTIDGLTNTGAIDVNVNTNMDVTGDLTDNGTILIDTQNAGGTTIVDFSGGTVSGTGTFTLNGANSAAQINGTLTQDAGHSIVGVGEINAALNNSGTVNANVNGQTIVLQNSNMTNDSVFEATAGGTLNINGITVTQNASGSVSAAGGTVTLTGSATISGGTLSSSSGSAIVNVNGTNTLASVTNNASIDVNVNTNMDVTGDLTDNGSFLIDTQNAGGTTILNFSGGTVSGTGTFTLNGGGGAAQINGTLTQDAGHSIVGVGEINAALTNSGTVNANINGQTLLLENSNMTNNSLFEATSGGILTANGITITQVGSAQILADHNSLVNLTNATITGGTINSAANTAISPAPSNAGLVQVLGTTTTFSGVTSNAQINIPVNNVLEITNNLTNNGTILVDSGNNGGTTIVSFLDNSELTGTGTIILNGGGTSAELNTGSGGSVTQDVHHSIVGVGEINAALTNNGLVNADVNGQTLTLQTNDMSNNSVFEATGNGILAISDITVTQTANGSINATGGTVNLNGSATISGGTLNSTGGGVFQNFGTNTLDNLTNNAQINIPVNNTLDVTGDLTNNGTILVDSGNNGGTTVVSFLDNSSELTGTGTIILNGGGTSAELNTGAGGSVTQDVHHSIVGVGEINAALTNNGLVNADVSGQTLTLQTSNMTNNSVFEATANGTLAISDITVTQTANGSINAAGGTVNLNGSATISGGTLNSISGSVFQTFGINTLDNLTNNAQINIPVNNTLDVTGNLTDNGTILVDSGNNGGTTVVDVAGGTVSGTGNIVLNGGGTSAELNDSLTQGAGHTVSGVGEINATLINNGTISADVFNQTLNVNGTTTNNGLMLATGGGILTIANGALTNFAGTTLTGGTYEVDPNSTINLPGLVTTNAANIILNGSPTNFAAIAPLATNSGSFTLKNGATFTTAGPLTTTGTVSIGPAAGVVPASVLAVTGLYLQNNGLTQVDGTLSVTGGVSVTGGTLKGIGTIVGPVSITGGVVAPGDSPGMLNITGTYFQGGGGELDIEVGGNTAGSNYDVLAITGGAILGGTLDVSLINDFVPAPGSTYTILTSGLGLGGSTFANFVAPPNFTVSYTDDSVVLNGVAVPEPASVALLGMAALLMPRRSRRRV
jgi:fibronectin-binding autotransporter adhesin